MPFSSGMKLPAVLPRFLSARLSAADALSLFRYSGYSSVQRFALIIPCKMCLSRFILVQEQLSFGIIQRNELNINKEAIRLNKHTAGVQFPFAMNAANGYIQTLTENVPPVKKLNHDVFNQLGAMDTQLLEASSSISTSLAVCQKHSLQLRNRFLFC